MKHILGAHTSIAGGVNKAISLASGLNFEAIQIFTKNTNKWRENGIKEDEAANFRESFKKSGIKYIAAHDSYLINLCAKDEDLLQRSREAFIDEIRRCELLGIPALNFHPGAHGGKGEDHGIDLIAESLNVAHEQTKGSPVCSMIETTAGQGTSIGYSFEQIRQIIDKIDEKHRMGVCIDTAHIFAAGYNIRDKHSYDEVIRQFDEIIGLDKLKLIHINDSKKALGTRVDRHEHIGMGFIGKEGFRNIMKDERLLNVPMVLETPKTKGQLEDLVNIKELRKLAAMK